MQSRWARSQRALTRVVLLVVFALLTLPALLGAPSASAAPAEARQAADISLPNGTVIRTAGTFTVYLMWAGRKNPIDSNATLQALGLGNTPQVDLPGGTVRSIPTGSTLGLYTVAGGLIYPLSPIRSQAVSLTLSRPSISPGQSVQLQGAGFQPGEVVTVTGPDGAFNTGTDGSGAFTVNVTVSGATGLGVARIFAQGTASGRFGVQVVHIIAPVANPTLFATPNRVVQGGSTLVNGTGFQAGEQVQLFLAGGVTVAATAASGAGTLNPIALVVPGSLTIGAHSLRAYGVSSSRYAEIQLEVISPVAAAPTPTATPAPVVAIGINPPTAGAGGQTLVNGTGFRPGETVLVSFNGALQGGIGADSSGNFGGYVLTVPTGTAAGAYAVTARGATSGRVAGINVTVVAAQPVTVAGISISPSSALPGSRISVAGAGFAPGEAVVIRFNNTPVQTVIADAGGAFTGGFFFLPGALSPGRYPVSAIGTSSSRTAGTTLSVAAPPPVVITQIFANPGNISPDGRLTVGGRGFAPREGILLRLDGVPVLQTTTDGAGTFSVVLTVHAGIGTHGITVTGLSSTRAASTSFNVFRPVTPGLGLTPANAYPGSVVRVTATNFQPGEIVLIRFRGVLVQAPRAGGDGRIVSVAFTVPANTPPGRPQVSVTGATSGRSATAILRVSPAPRTVKLSVSSASVHHGTAITLSGSGFVGGEVILIKFRGGIVLAPTADRNGKFSGVRWTIPANSPFGKQTLVATGGRSGRSVTATVQVTPAPSLGVSASPGTVIRGHGVTVSGHGFTKGETVLIALRGAIVQAVTADKNGNFHGVSFTIPSKSPRGRETITATGARSGKRAVTQINVL